MQLQAAEDQKILLRRAGVLVVQAVLVRRTSKSTEYVTVCYSTILRYRHNYVLGKIYYAQHCRLFFVNDLALIDKDGCETIC